MTTDRFYFRIAVLSVLAASLAACTQPDPESRGASPVAPAPAAVASAATAPVAKDDAVRLREDTSLTTDVLANDTGVDRRTARLEISVAPEHGTAVVLTDNTIKYTPNADYSGTDSYVYRVTSGGMSSTARVAITVDSQDDGFPIARDDSVRTPEDEALTINVLKNDENTLDAPLTINIVAPPQHGTLVVNREQVTYQPFKDFLGIDTFKYTFTDVDRQTSERVATVTIDVFNRPPVLADDAVTGYAPRVVVNVLDNDSDPDGDPLTVTAVSTPAHGKVTFEPSGQITYVPEGRFTGADVFTYTVSDGRGNTATARVNVTVEDSAPVTVKDAITAYAQCVVTNVLANDSDPDGDPLAAAVNTPPAHGSVTLDPNGTVHYVPTAGFSGVDTFTYTASDGRGRSSTETVTINVRAGTDSDCDGLSDDEERAARTDPYDADSDDDGVIDGQEPSWNVDSDGDGLINALDPDSDNDGIFDGTEMGVTQPGPATDLSKHNFVPDADPSTTTNPLERDTDHGGVPDGAEDPNHNGRIDPGERNPNDAADDKIRSLGSIDSDGDGLSDEEEIAAGTDPHDADSDDDGIIDGKEANWNADTDGDGLINALDPDSDNDGVFDGTEVGITTPGPATNVAAGHFIPDADPTTTTGPLLPDTDYGGVKDGDEDVNHNGKVDPGERDPNVGADDLTRPTTTTPPPPEEAYGVRGGGGCSAAGAGGLSAVLLLALAALGLRRRGRSPRAA